MGLHITVVNNENDDFTGGKMQVDKVFILSFDRFLYVS